MPGGSISEDAGGRAPRRAVAGGAWDFHAPRGGVDRHASGRNGPPWLRARLGSGRAIARSTQSCLTLGTPFVATIIGEGGSGGAVAIAAANKVYMLEHSIYSVISPEGCASILWHKSDKAADAAAAMKITAQ